MQRIEMSLGDVDEAKISKDWVVIECNNLDEITRKCGIPEIVQSQIRLQSVVEANVFQFRKAYGDTYYIKQSLINFESIINISLSVRLSVCRRLDQSRHVF